MTKKTNLEFNPENMTVSDLKKTAEALRTILRKYQDTPEDMDLVWSAVAQCADAFKVT